MEKSLARKVCLGKFQFKAGDFEAQYQCNSRNPDAPPTVAVRTGYWRTK